VNRLSDVTVTTAAPAAIRPAYDRATVRPGVVHLGPGAFHRAHQAYYFDELLAADPRWGITEIALKSTSVKDALSPQDGLYTLVQLGETTGYRIVGAIKGLLTASREPDAVLARLADAETKLITLTITEKGYCLGSNGGLDLENADVKHDLEGEGFPVSAIGWLVAGLKARREAGVRPPVILSCDNLASNGHRLKRAVLDFARASDAGLADWIEAETRFPCSMVDSITPATDDALRTRVAEAIGLEDAWPIQREIFTQWVVEDILGDEAPDLASVGVTLSKDVEAFEAAKLRLLNGPHSTLAYMGSLKGHETVADAMKDAELAGFVETLMLQDIAPTVPPTPGLDTTTYSKAILDRFRNPAIRHLLSQIAWDGSMKLPYRLLGTVRDALAAGRTVERLAVPIAAWMRFVEGAKAAGRTLTDPLADKLFEAAGDVDRFLAIEAVFGSDLPKNEEFVSAVKSAYAKLG
jgi:fructuronate reductase